MQPRVVSLVDVKKPERSDGKPTRNGKELPKPKRNFAHPQGKVVTTNRTKALPLFVERLKRKHLEGIELTKEQYKLLKDAGELNKKQQQKAKRTSSGSTTSSPARRIVMPPNSASRKRKRKPLQIEFKPRSPQVNEGDETSTFAKLSSGLSTSR